MEYYKLEGPVKQGTAFANATIPIVSGDENELVAGKKELPFGMKLVKMALIKGQVVKSDDVSNVEILWTDYQPNEFAWPLMSDRMATVVRAHLTGHEGIDWISSPVSAKGELRQYWVPRFSRLLDTLDLERTTRTDSGMTIRPWFSLEKIKDLAMFQGRPEFWEITSSLVVNEPLMKAIKRAKLSGVSFSPARSS